MLNRFVKASTVLVVFLVVNSCSIKFGMAADDAKKQIEDAKKRLWSESTPSSEKSQGENFPQIGGEWSIIVDGKAAHTINIVQQGDKFTATCSYQHPQEGEIRWSLTGTITKEGRISGRMVHTKAPKGWKNQQHIAVLTAEGSKIKGAVVFDGGGGHDYLWTLSKPAVVAKSEANDTAKSANENAQPAGSDRGKTDDTEVTYLDDLKEAHFEVGYGVLGKQGTSGFPKPAVQRCRLDISAPREVKHSLSLHPKGTLAKQAGVKGDPVAHVTYELQKPYAVFRATAALNFPVRDDGMEFATRERWAGQAVTPVKFRVLGNGKLLWESRPMEKSGDSQECQVEIAGVDKLRLEVTCDGKENFAWAFWGEPCVENSQASALSPSVAVAEKAPKTPDKKPGAGKASSDDVTRQKQIDKLCRDLSANAATDRARAAKLLGEMGRDAESATIDLCTALVDRHATVRMAASEALEKVNPEIRELVLPVAADEDRGRRIQTLKKIADSGSEALAGVAIVLFRLDVVMKELAAAKVQFNDRLTRPQEVIAGEAAACIEALFAIGRDDVDVAEALMRTALKNVVPSLRNQAIGCLPHMGIKDTKRIVSVLTTAAMTDVDGNRATAAESLGKMGRSAKSAIDPLRKLKGHSNSAVRDAAELAVKDIERDIAENGKKPVGK